MKVTRASVALIAAPILLFGATAAANATPQDSASSADDAVAAATSQLASGRISGSTRWGTGVEVSKQLLPTGRWPDGSQVDDVFIVSGYKSVEAMATGAAAATYGPILLVPSYGRPPAEVINEIKRINPRMVNVVGGRGSISTYAYNRLPSGTDGKQRISGSSRFDVARKLALMTAAARKSGGDSPVERVFIVNHADYPGAIAAGAAAARTNGVVLLTHKTRLTSPTVSALRSLQPTHVTFVGTTRLIATRARAEAKRVLPPSTNITRVHGGNSRYGNASALSASYFSSSDGAFLVSGKNFYDGLTTVGLAGAVNAPILLTPGHCITSSTAAELSRLGAGTLVGVGSTRAVQSSALVDQRAC